MHNEGNVAMGRDGGPLTQLWGPGAPPWTCPDEAEDHQEFSEVLLGWGWGSTKDGGERTKASKRKQLSGELASGGDGGGLVLAPRLTSKACWPVPPLQFLPSVSARVPEIRTPRHFVGGAVSGNGVSANGKEAGKEGEPAWKSSSGLLPRVTGFSLVTPHSLVSLLP